MSSLIVTLLQWAAGFLVWGRFRGCVTINAEGTRILSGLSIIIPARNEERNLPVLLQSLAAQPAQAREIIVVDDGSSDRTAEMARATGAMVIASDPLPAGWRGKTWACHQGAQHACGDFFLFLDADTWFEPHGLERTLSAFPATGRGALSVAPFHRVKAFHEQFSAFFNLVMLGGSAGFTPFQFWRSGKRLLGQFLLIDRESYEKVGGHESVKERVLENFWLSEKLQAARITIETRVGRGCFCFRMYPEGWASLVNGWTKGFASGAGQTPLPILALIICWIGGILFTPIALATQNHPLSWLILYALYAAQTRFFLRRVGTFHWLTAVLCPVMAVFFLVVFTWSLLRSGKTATWKGRTLHAT